MSEQANEKVMENLEQITSWLQTTLETGGDFVAEQAPLVVQEIITFGRVWETSVVLGMCIAFGITALAIRLLLLRLRAEDAKESKDQEDYIFATCIICPIVLAIAMIPIVVIFCTSFRPCLMAWFAPRLYVLEYIKEVL